MVTTSKTIRCHSRPYEGLVVYSLSLSIYLVGYQNKDIQGASASFSTTYNSSVARKVKYRFFQGRETFGRFCW
jgi:hypothetical protein